MNKQENDNQINLEDLSVDEIEQDEVKVVFDCASDRHIAVECAFHFITIQSQVVPED